VSWRLLGLDPSGIGFNLYRSTAGGTAVKLNRLTICRSMFSLVRAAVACFV